MAIGIITTSIQTVAIIKTQIIYEMRHSPNITKTLTEIKITTAAKIIIDGIRITRVTDKM